MTAFVSTASGCRIQIRAQPRASRTEITGLYGEAVRVRVAAPPVDGAANDELLRFLADRLGTSRRNLALARGVAGRTKLVDVTGIAADDARRRLGV